MSFCKTTLTVLLSLLTTFSPIGAFAIEPFTPIKRLKNGFFTSNLAAPLNAYLSKDGTKCLALLGQVKITPYTNEPEKYYLLKALCSPKESQPAAAIDNVNLALREKGSSPDVIYAAAIILSQVGVDVPAVAPTPVPTPEGSLTAPTPVPYVGAYEEALKRYQEAIWFGSLQKFNEKDFYLDYGTLQYFRNMYGEAQANLTKAISLGADTIDSKFMLADIAIKSLDRKNAISLSRQFKAARDDVIAKETLLLALMTAADPVFHKRDVAEAAKISLNLSDASLAKADVANAAVKSLMITNDLGQANVKLQKALAANPSDPRLQALNTQIKAENALIPAPE